MLHSEDKQIKLGGVTLPGLIKKYEVKPSALVEEVEVEGATKKPKQATGYADAKLTIELIVDDTATATAADALARIKSIFRRDKSQQLPQPVAIISAETALLDITQVLITDLTIAKSNKTSQYTVTLELCEYIPVTITATAASGGQAAKPSQQLNLTADYQRYLQAGRGNSPITDVPAPAVPKKYGKWD